MNQTSEQILPGARTEKWPRWVSLATLVAGVVSIPLILLIPPLAAGLALAALVVGLIGARRHTGPERREFRIAAAMGGLSLVLLAIASLTLLSAGTEGLPLEDAVPTSETTD